MTPFEALSLFLALLAVFIAVFIKRPVVMPKIQFGSKSSKRWTLEQAIEHVKARDAKKQKRDSKGRFA